MNILNLKVNQTNYTVLVDPHEMLSTVLRDKLNLTGTKIGCNQGSCGACTVHLNGKAILSCITPALRCDGSEVNTIESLESEGKLHTLQEKFIEKGAIQCGFCTPGMIMTALGASSEIKNGGSVDEIKTNVKEALSGNLCRCTGYKKIIEAVTDFAIGETYPTIRKEDDNNDLKIVGTPRPYIESEKKAKGKADYADDLKTKNALVCKILRSKMPHAILKNIDISEALQLEGVKYILLGNEIQEKFGVLPISNDETALAIDKVRYVGEPIAAIAAENESIAIEAIKKIKVDYEPLKPFFTISESLSDLGELTKIHNHTKFNNNIHKKAELRFGDQKQGFDESEFVSEMEFEFAGISHAFTEPHASTAYYDENGLTIYTATQVPHYLHRTLAKTLKIPLHRIRVVKPYVGGGFGGKSDPFPHEIIVSFLALKTGRPVKINFSREEVFISNHGRHPSTMKVKLGISNEGIIKALDADIAIDGGAYGSFGVVTSYYNGVLLQAPYKVNNFGFRTFRVYTNKPQSGAMRGHGAVNSRFAVESLIDDLAYKINMDPVKLRLLNLLDNNTLTVGEYRITSNGSKDALNTVVKQSDWENKFRKLKEGHGIGVGCGFFISGSALPIIRNDLPQSVVHLKLDFDGRVVIYSGASDIGQGSDTMLVMIVAEVLGISMDKIFVLAADTLHTPVDLGSYSSRVTFMAGNAAKMAAENLKSEIFEAVSKVHNCQVIELNIVENRVFSNDNTLSIDWLDAVEMVTASRGAFTTHGKYISPKLGGDFKGSGAGLSPSYSFGSCIAEVNVDLETGFVKLLNIWGAHDCGKAINPLAVEGQLEGSWHMGIGQALSEEIRYFNGLMLNNNFLDYKIPTSIDTPEINTNIIESIDPEGPFGAKECGEGAIHPVIPAIANAIFDAVGVRVKKLPITPEYIIELLGQKHFKEETLI